MATVDPVYAYNYYLNQGWTPIQSAAIVGSAFGESGLRTTAVGDSGLAKGLFQWHPDRQQGFYNTYNTSVLNGTPDQQLAYFQKELLTTEKKAGNWLRSTNTIEDATYAVMRGALRPANDSSLGTRLAAAKDVLKKAGSKLLGNTANDAIQGAIGTGLEVATASNPFVAATLGAMKMMGIDLGLGGESCGIVCQLRQWIEQTHIVSRIAIFIVAAIFVIGGLSMLGKGMITRTVNEAIG